MYGELALVCVLDAGVIWAKGVLTTLVAAPVELAEVLPVFAEVVVGKAMPPSEKLTTAISVTSTAVAALTRAFLFMFVSLLKKFPWHSGALYTLPASLLTMRTLTYGKGHRLASQRRHSLGTSRPPSAQEPDPPLDVHVHPDEGGDLLPIR